MELNALTAISPIDGRYRSKTEELSEYFSEFALIRYRVLVEIEYFIALCEIPLPALADIDNSVFSQLQKIYQEFSVEDAQKIKDIEKVTNHDVKAVEYFIKEKFDALSLQKYKEYIHFGLTSQDINNTSIPFSIKEALNKSYYPLLEKLIAELEAKATEWKDVAMLAKTHGQPASPTRLGKEIMVFVSRLKVQLSQLKQMPISAKFGGATGNFNAHHVAFPKNNWKEFGNDFVSGKLGLQREEWTTQISNYDNLGAIFDGLKKAFSTYGALAKVLDEYAAKGYIVEFFRMEHNDYEMESIRRIVSLMRYNDNVRVHPFMTTTEEHLKEVASCQCFIGYKTHSVIMALATATPLAAIAYHEKTMDFMRTYGLGEYAIFDEELDYEKLQKCMRNVSENAEMIHEKQKTFSQMIAQTVKKDLYEMVNNEYPNT
jgi:phosphopantetheinyl transferase (holo-ACP synthase)